MADNFGDKLLTPNGEHNADSTVRLKHFGYPALQKVSCTDGFRMFFEQDDFA